MKLSKSGLELIKSFEGCVLYVYDDLRPPVNGKYREWRRGDPIKGTLTCGVGHTDDAKYKLGFLLRNTPDGFRLTEQQAMEILDVDLDECEEAVNNLVKVPLSQGQFDALVSFAYNCGTSNLRKLIVPLNKGDYKVCRAKFDLYVKSKGITLRGLQRRRDAEQALWDSHAEPDELIDHPAEVEAEKEPMSAPTAAAGASVVAVPAASLTTSAMVSAPPETVTNTVSNVDMWRTLGETVSGMAAMASQRPGLAASIVVLFIAVTFGPLIKGYLPTITWGAKS